MNKWMKQLNKLEGAVDREYNPYDDGNYIQIASPSVNYIFSKCPGFPYGEFMLLWGPPKSGKSILCNSFIAGVHAQDPEAVVIKFDTEMRETGQIEPFWGIDPDRYLAFNVNEPEYVFDRLINDIKPLVEDGMKLRLIIIDSLRNIAGVKASNAASVTQHQMGDKAMTIQKGLEAIMPFLRRNKIALIATEHIRGNLDAGMYGPKEKMAGGWHEKHTFEYYIKVTRNNNKADTYQSASGEKFEKDIKDFKGNKEVTGHKIFVAMTESSRGVAGRTGQITFNYNKGIVNIEDEIFELVKNLNIVERPNNRSYVFGEKKYDSKGNFIKAIQDDIELKNTLLTQIYEKNKE